MQYSVKGLPSCCCMCIAVSSYNRIMNTSGSWGEHHDRGKFKKELLLGGGGGVVERGGGGGVG